MQLHITISDMDDKKICASQEHHQHDDDHTTITNSTWSTMSTTTSSLSCRSAETSFELATSNDPDRPLLWAWKDLEQAVADSRAKEQPARRVRKSARMREMIEKFGGQLS